MLALVVSLFKVSDLKQTSDAYGKAVCRLEQQLKEEKIRSSRLLKRLQAQIDIVHEETVLLSGMCKQ